MILVQHDVVGGFDLMMMSYLLGGCVKKRKSEERGAITEIPVFNGIFS